MGIFTAERVVRNRSVHKDGIPRDSELFPPQIIVRVTRCPVNKTKTGKLEY